MLRGTLSVLSFRGRLSRRTYWRRFPGLVALPVAVAAVCWAIGVPLLDSIGIVALAALPLFSAGARRLQDTGAQGFDAIKPWASFAAAVVLGTWAAQSLHMVRTAFASDTPPDGPGGFGFVIVFFHGGGLLALVALGLLISFAVQITPAVAQTLFPATPGPNEYGPNPNEVPK